MSDYYRAIDFGDTIRIGQAIGPPERYQYEWYEVTKRDLYAALSALHIIGAMHGGDLTSVVGGSSLKLYFKHDDVGVIKNLNENRQEKAADEANR